jgi:asparagine synthase (glutamine-hydrolysing)
MCGISGSIAFTHEGKKRLAAAKQSVDFLKKRGPDGNGIYTSDNVALAHARLSIIDTSNNGAQPFIDASGRYVLVFNGEFFNFKSHRDTLLKQGITFKSESDTEVLLYLLIRDGIACLDEINGFFSFAFHDTHTNQTWIVRDRYGEKPLLYSHDGEGLSFASEIKALEAFGMQNDLDSRALSIYFHLNYTPAPLSIFKHIKKLEPGHYLHISNGEVQLHRWYSLSIKKSDIVYTYAEAQDKLRELMEDAVSLRMIADVPLGCFLSGGIDSSVVTALASQHTQKLNTFSIGYRDEPLFDETHYAQSVAKMYGTYHTVFSLTNDDLFHHLHEMLDYFDEPFADSSALAVYILCKETRKHATVALSGDGADELFGGYRKHEAEWRIRQGGIAAKSVALLQPLWNRLPASRNSKAGDLIRKLRKFAAGMNQSPRVRYWNWCGYADTAYLHSLIHNDFKSSEVDEYKELLVKHIANTSGINDMLMNDIHLVLPNDMLFKVDSMSMANSLEVRSPFMDYRVVEFAVSLPSEFKVNAKGRKQIVQDTFRDILPAELYNRPKQGFEVPLLAWFRGGLHEWIFNDLLNKNFIERQGIFNFEAIQQLQKALNSSSPGDAVARTWALVVFQSWYKKRMK